MTGYLSSLVERTLGTGPAIEPRRRSAFEPAAATHFFREADRDDLISERPNEQGHPSPAGSIRAPSPISPSSKTAASANPDSDSPQHRSGFELTRLRLRLDPQKRERRNIEEQGRDTTEPAPANAVSRDNPEPVRDRLVSRVESSTSDEPANEVPTAPASAGLVPTPQIKRPRVVAPASTIPRGTLSHTSPRPTANRAPIVKVTIGRVEVRANISAPPTTRHQPAKPRSTLSLDDYLKSRSGGGR